MITTGTTGGAWRASITPWGSIEVQEPGGLPATLDWFVAADDRWHVPATEAGVRQRRIDGTAVTETRVRVPRGDVVQHVYSCADAGGLTVVEVTNESTLPVAIAFSHRRLMTERPIAAVPIEGIDLPPDAFVMPLGHTATLRVAIAHDGSADRSLPPGLPSALQVARGWTSLSERAGRLVLPDGALGSALAERVVAERCELALGAVPIVDEQPDAFAVALHELVRMGEGVDEGLPELVVAVEAIARRQGWAADAGLVAAGRTLALVGERRAAGDLERIVARRPHPVAPPPDVPEGVLAIAWIEQRLLDESRVLPFGLPAEWLGQSIETYGLPAGRRPTSVAFALRWHGERPAVLWEQTGEPIELTSPVCAPDWRSRDVRGEALWPAPLATA